MIFVFDTETTGLVNTREPPDHPSQPHIVQLAMLLCDETGKEMSAVNIIIKPDGYDIPAAASEVHGITTGIAHDFGIPLIPALAVLSHMAKRGVVHVAHNVDFDIKVIQAAFHRANRPCPPINARCTQALSTTLVNLPPSERMLKAGFNKPKPPRLSECVKFFFDEELVGAHDAMVDTRACARVYFELARRGIVPPFRRIDPVAA